MRKHPIDKMNHFEALLVVVAISFCLAALIFAGIMGIISNL